MKDETVLISHKNDDTEPVLNYSTFQIEDEIKNTFSSSDVKEELIEILKLSLSNIFGMTFRMLAPVVSVFMCGSLGKFELDAVTLSNSIVAITNLSLSGGFSAAMDAVFSQTYGQPNKRKNMGHLLQRILLLISLVMAVLISIIINMEMILLSLNQNPSVSKMAAIYLQIYSPAILFEVLFNVFTRYSNNQNIYYPSAVIGFIGLIFNITGQYIVLHVFRWSYLTSAAWQSVTIFLMLIAHFIYIILSPFYKETWTGFDLKETFRNWLPFLKLSFENMLCNLSLNIFLESFALIAGTFGVVSLGANGIAFQIYFSSYLLLAGVLTAMAVRVGQELGANKVEFARFSFKVGSIVCIVLSVTMTCLIVALKDYLHRIFTSNEDIIRLGSTITPLVGVFYTCITIFFIPMSVLKATGQLRIPAFLSFVGLFFAGETSGVILALLTDLKLIGLWIGICLGFLLTGISLFVLIGLMDWKKYTQMSSSYDPDEEWWSTTQHANPSIRLMVVKIIVIVTVICIFIISIFIAIFVPTPCLPDEERKIFNSTVSYSFMNFCNNNVSEIL